MLDLKKLENKLDKALENAEPDKLTNWLINKRNKDASKLLGTGQIVHLPKRSQSGVFTYEILSKQLLTGSYLGLKDFHFPTMISVEVNEILNDISHYDFIEENIIWKNIFSNASIIIDQDDKKGEPNYSQAA